MTEVHTAASLNATVAICTYNGAKRIGEVLCALAHQTLAPREWELVVIDNASKDGTGELAEQIIKEQLAGHGRVVRETQPGLVFARSRAANEARAPIVCFLDDDNIPEADFVERAVEAFGAYPRAGLLGGKVRPRWEGKPSPLALAVADYALAICDHGNSAFAYKEITSGPVGAGMCLRTDLIRQLYSDNSLNDIPGRTGSSLGACDDTALVVRVHQAGWEVWYIPHLRIEHLIPARRTEMDYLVKLYEGFGRSHVHLRALYDKKTKVKWLRSAIGIKDLGRWMLGQFAGPSKKTRQQYPELAPALHQLEQRMTRARALEALGIKSD